MDVFSLKEKFNVWTKSTIVEVLKAVGDEEFSRSESKEALLERLEDYFVCDVLDVASVKALSQLADVVGIKVKTKKGGRGALVSSLQDFQVSMKEQALVLIQETEDAGEEFKRLLRLVLGTDAETTQAFTEAFEDLQEDDGEYD